MVADGTKIVFVSSDIFEQSSREIYVMNTDGSNVQRLTNNPTGDANPKWSPDGTKIAFVRIRVGTPQCPSGAFCSYEIYVMNANGTNQTRLTDSPAGDFSPIFSPDSTKIAFISHRDSNGAIYVMNADGSSQTLLTNTATGAQLDWQALSLTSPSCPNPIDCAEFFVRQHYLDFLSREPDPAGLAFWTNEIISCGADAQCVEAKRVYVSAAFFLSIEFQQTGYLVQRIYKAAYGDAAADVPGTVFINRLAEFLPDTRKVAEGVQVGIGDWQQQLEANKQAFALEFVQRARFLSAYPQTMTPADFVNSLDTRAGGVLSQSERDQLAAELAANDTATGRASVLRRIAEDEDLARAEFNRAFVLMQYFGYLRRNPDDAPDAGFGGWKFWLQKLDQFDGDFAAAVMVKAFLSSTEYRSRFGQP